MREQTIIKISDLIKILENKKKQYGDLQVIISLDEYQEEKIVAKKVNREEIGDVLLLTDFGDDET